MVKQAKNPIHGVDKKKFFQKRWFAEVVCAVPPIVTSVFAAWKLRSEGLSPWLLGAMVCVPVWLLIGYGLKALQAWSQDNKDEDVRSHDGLIGALTVLHAEVANAGGLATSEDRGKVRVTFHRVVPPLNGAEKIEQIVRYVGGEGGGPGRTFSIRSGITGKAIREAKTYVMDRKSESFDEYMKELIREWNYTDEDVKKFTADRFAAMAVPIKSKVNGGHAVLGVVYLDSSIRSFFGNKAVQEAVLVGCMGLAEYTGERYV